MCTGKGTSPNNKSQPLAVVASYFINKLLSPTNRLSRYVGKRIIYIYEPLYIYIRIKLTLQFWVWKKRILRKKSFNYILYSRAMRLQKSDDNFNIYRWWKELRLNKEVGKIYNEFWYAPSMTMVIIFVFTYSELLLCRVYNVMTRL